MGFDLDKGLERALQGEILEEQMVKLICIKVKEIFIQEPNVKNVRTPVTCIGDIHGQFIDLQEIFQVGGHVPLTNYLFLGDYVDRGPQSVEVITLLFLLKIKYPERVTILRGNHETRGITQNYGFYVECQKKYGNTLVWEFYTDVFDYIPIGAIIDQKVFCVHGGLSPSIETIDQIAQLDRFQEIPHEGAFTDLMWSDPKQEPDDDLKGFTLSSRGAGYYFGGDVLKKFLQLNKMEHLVRAHQLCQEGYQILFDNQMSTVWSAPNYMYRFKNLASILEIDEQGNRHFNIFSESPENFKKGFTSKIEEMMAGGDKGDNDTKVIKLRDRQTRMYDGDTYDVYDSSDFLDEIQGYNVYGFSLWYKLSSSSTNQLLFHMTFLDNDEPWDYSSQTSSYQHLSYPMGCITGSTMTCSFSTLQSQLSFSSISQSTNEWYFLFVGINQETRYHIATLYSESGTKTSVNYDDTANLATFGIGNEELDERIKLYVGGSKGRASGNNFDGVIFDPTFYAGFDLNDVSYSAYENYYVFLGEKSYLYYINLNQLESDRFYDYYGQEVYASFVSGNSPTFSSTNGLYFAATSTMSINVNKEFDQAQFLSFWIYFDALGSTTNFYNIFEVQNTDGDILFSLIYYFDTQVLYAQCDTTKYSTGQTINTGTWYHFFISFEIQPFLDNLIFTLEVNGSNVFGSSIAGVFSNDIPSNRNTNMQIIFGEASYTTFEGYLRDIIGGIGGWIDNSIQQLTNCDLSIGIADPFCLLCSAGYYQQNGECINYTCDDGFYVDTTTKICRKCHVDCKTCSGPDQDECSTCDIDKPLLLSGFCFSNCPEGSFYDEETKDCLCDNSCTTCSYSSISGIQCSVCAEADTYIQGSKCVQSQNCLYGTFADDDTGACETSCVNTDTWEDHLNRKCVNSSTDCPEGTNIYTAGSQCLLECPDTFYYSATGAAEGSGVALNDCISCGVANNCSNCEDLTTCTSCQTGYLLHETGECELSCNSGYVQEGYICRVCYESCSSCPANFYLYESTCLDECPLGYVENTGTWECDVDTVPYVNIKTDSASINVGRKEDLFIQGEYYYIGNIESEEWTLTGATTSESEKFFSKTFNTYSHIHIPYSNLESDKTYTLVYTVTTDAGISASDTVTIQTSEEIDKGKFTVSPAIGISGYTEFTITYSDWTYSDTLYFDILYGKNYTFTSRGQTVNQFEEAAIILFKSTDTDNSLTFTFPPILQEKEVTLRLKVYSTDEEQFMYFDINLQPFEIDEEDQDNYDFQSSVWYIKLQDSLDINDYYERSGYLRYLYQDQQQKAVQQQSKVDFSKQKQNLKIMPSECDNDIQCRGAGQCTTNFYDENYYECECFWDQDGQYCSWEERTLQTLQNVTYQIFYNLSQLQYTDTELYKMSQILNDLSKVDDGVHKKSFRLVNSLLSTLISNFNPGDISIYQTIVETISNFLHQSVTRPDLRTDEKQKYSVIFNNYIKEVAEIIKTDFLRLNEDIIIENNYLTIFLSIQTGAQLMISTTNENDRVIFPLKRSVVHIPYSVYTSYETYINQLIQYNFDPIYPQQYSISSQISVQIFDINNESISVSGLSTSNPIKLYLRKLNSYPPLETNSPYFYQCNYLRQITDDTFEWINDSSNLYFNFENEHFIECQSTHLSQFAVQRGLLEFIALPEDNILEFYGMDLLNINLKKIDETTFNNDYNIERSQRPFLTYEYPGSRFKFIWTNPSGIICLVLLLLYLIFSIINYIRWNYYQIQIYTYEHLEVLLLSYHPIISVILRGQTFHSHTYHMRMTKFFALLISIISITAIAFRKFSLANERTWAGQIVVSSAFFAIFITAFANIIVELFYTLIYKQCNKSKHNQVQYSVIFFTYMLAISTYGGYENGNTNSQEHSTYVLAFIVAFLIDFMFFDILVVILAYFYYDSSLLKIFAQRGFFIRSQLKELVPQQVQIEETISQFSQRDLGQNAQEGEQLKEIDEKLDNNNLKKQQQKTRHQLTQEQLESSKRSSQLLFEDNEENKEEKKSQNTEINLQQIQIGTTVGKNKQTKQNLQNKKQKQK
ncbi:Insulin-like growth factor binding protein, N-terminal [Pseudocohnilembus persalinus]|uniref:Serine/threonine-protein phosphatase n=1 Tax=Pseudocohnilembus persalinus TaxID=266149 RepID=A0A0V0QHS3_PSEPJ|nr:Insulin-like growth factor binding protein, N-terminal [Pseudocohnilembus persalinus]|eukprot:KRX01807.1 Insulin-like growth factor binding protein, N-terminal [Pseudocohnilembus persalinus]